MNRPRIDNTMRRQNATKSKLGRRFSDSTRGHTYQACRRIPGKSSYIKEKHEEATPVLGSNLSASTRCTPPAHQFDEALIAGLGL
jgi:hypothetical protein